MTPIMWLAAALLPAAPAADAYDIKLKTAGVGDVVLVERTSTYTTVTQITNGKAVGEATEKSAESYVYRETILAQEAGKAPTKLRREYDKAQSTEHNKTTDFPFAGKTLLIERQKGGKYHFQIEGGTEVTGDDASALNNEFNMADDASDFEQYLLPDHSVRAAEDWKLDMAPIVRYANQAEDQEGDADKARRTGKLVKVYPKDDRRFGHLLIHYEFPVKSTGGGKDKQETLEGSVEKYDFEIEGCIDGKRIDEITHANIESTTYTNMPLESGKEVKKIVIARVETVETSKEQPKK